ncbi:MAG: extracellular solute-binding protein [Clostridia bacterium]|jgi:multiple sugar transport system substrate-binding protein|nr:extracellular solute-binding protein [Clostridia bacterium]MCI1999779.1 extracellular solute-binding protein [Clostridia bacterium]MCI2014305.1 extracellular solute-binding protein [Clostridia bacterium]
MVLKGITWSHSRGYVPLVATSQRFSELHPDVKIEWEQRSLQEFSDFPIDTLAKSYDLLIIDHPWAGYAASTGILLPLNKHLPEDYLKNQADNSVGKSFLSYNFDGFQSALAIDAASPIAVYRPDYFENKEHAIPETFEDVLSLAKKRKVAFSGIPLNLLMDFYMFCATANDNIFQKDNELVDMQTGEEVLENMRELASYCNNNIFSWDPIHVHEAMALDSDIVYCPYVYGYSNYSRRGYGKHLLKACNLVKYKGNMLKGVLGGTGIAVSSKSKYIDTAVAVAKYTASEEVQKTIYTENGGQPGHRAAWLDKANNYLTSDFFINTLQTLDNSYLRPRYNGYLYFQDNAGVFIQDYVQHGGNPKTVLTKLNDLYCKSKGGIL